MRRTFSASGSRFWKAIDSMRSKGSHAVRSTCSTSDPGRLPPVGSTVVIPVAVLLFAGVRGTPGRDQEGLHQQIVEVEILMGDEAEEMEVAIRLRSS